MGLLMTMIVLSSCADLWIVKRRYNRGYFISPNYKERKRTFDQKRAVVLEQRSLNRTLASRPAKIVPTTEQDSPPIALVSYVNVYKSLKYSIGAADAQTNLGTAEVVNGNGSINRPSVPVIEQVVPYTDSNLKMAESFEATLNKKRRTTWGNQARNWWGLFAMALLSTQFLLHRKTSKFAHSFGRWAAANPSKARAWIAVSTIALAYSSLQLGMSLASSGISFGKESLYASWVIASGGVLLNWMGVGSRRKLAYVLLISGGTLSMLPTGELAHRTTQEKHVLSAVYHSTIEWNKELYDHSVSAFIPSDFNQKLQEKFSTDSPKEPMSSGKAFALIVISVIAFAILQYLVLMFTCSLSCAGYEIAAVLLGFGGTALLLFALIYSILLVANRRRMTKEMESVNQ